MPVSGIMFDGTDSATNQFATFFTKFREQGIKTRQTIGKLTDSSAHFASRVILITARPGHHVLLTAQGPFAFVTTEAIDVPGLVLCLGAGHLHDQLITESTARLEEFQEVSEAVQLNVLAVATRVKIGPEVDDDFAANRARKAVDVTKQGVERGGDWGGQLTGDGACDEGIAGQRGETVSHADHDTVGFGVYQFITLETLAVVALVVVETRVQLRLAKLILEKFYVARRGSQSVLLRVDQVAGHVAIDYHPVVGGNLVDQLVRSPGHAFVAVEKTLHGVRFVVRGFIVGG